MYNHYHVRVSVKNSTGNELVKIFNFTTVSKLDNINRIKLVCVLSKIAKENYNLKIEDHWKHPAKNTPTEFIELCHALSEWRFYETRREGKYEETTEHVHLFSMQFPTDIELRSFHSDWGGTFFELTVKDNVLTHFINVDFEKVKKEFESHSLDLHKSKTEGLWYTHYNVQLVPVCNELMVEQQVKSYKWVCKEEKVEL